MHNSDVIIVGGGLAGLIAAIHLRNSKFEVLILEKNDYPKHKVCGEYISNEVLPYLKSLQLDIPSLTPKNIDKLNFSLVSGKSVNTPLPLGGFGLSRFTLDNYLFDFAKKIGCIFSKETVSDIDFKDDIFTVYTNKKNHNSKIVLGAFGKRSNLDVQLKRNFIQNKSHWLGVKAHYSLDFPDDLVGLHHFKGGYCGVSKVENGLVNICYLANYDTFKKFKTIEEYQNNILNENPNLKNIFEKATLQFKKPLTISQVSFDAKKCVENHVLMIGDSAGLIHPLCGNGMAMAIHSAKLASENAIAFLNNTLSRNQFENRYTNQWNLNFKNRLKTGRRLESFLKNDNLAPILLNILIMFPFLLQYIIKRTHGKTI